MIKKNIWGWCTLAGLTLAAGTMLCSGAEAPAKSLEELIADLKNPDPRVRVQATDGLMKLGPKAKPAVLAYLEAMDGKAMWADASMMEAFNLIGPVAVPDLLQVVEHGQPAMRVRATKALWAMGANAGAALPTLQKYVNDPDEMVKKQVAVAIGRISSELAEKTERAKVNVDPKAALKPAFTETAAAGWSQFRGPNRDNLCSETGLLAEWPKSGLKLLWKTEGLGKGMASVTFARGKIFTLGDRPVPDGKDQQFAMAFDQATHQQVWATKIGAGYEHGGLSTPTIDGELLYTLSTDGILWCLETDTGKERWHKSLPDDFGGKMMKVWKFSESPLIDGDRVICTPGSSNATIVALNKKTGEVIWKTAVPKLGDRGQDGAGYASAKLAEIDGVRQYIQMYGRGAVSVAADDGRVLWGYNRIASDIANIPNPIVRGNYVFLANGYSTGAALLKVTRDGDKFKAEEVYWLASKDFQNHHGGVVLAGDFVYGGSGVNKGEPTCIEMMTGRVCWKEKAPEGGSAAVLYADGHVLFRYDRGLLVWAEATPAGFKVQGSFMPLTGAGPAWSYPVIQDKKLYLRHDNLLMCYDLSGK